MITIRLTEDEAKTAAAALHRYLTCDEAQDWLSDITGRWDVVAGVANQLNRAVKSPVKRRLSVGKSKEPLA
jgi:hypothetical protein